MKNRTEQITFTRFLAALSIVIFHSGSKLFFYTNDNISFIFKKANIGVSYFYILSGFIMIVAYGSSKKIKTIDYYKNRFARIYPMYFVALFLYIILKHAHNITEIILNILGIQAWIPHYALSLNYPGWSISVECFFYLLFPFLMNFIYNGKPSLVTYVLIPLIWVGSQIFTSYYIHSHWYKLPPSNSHNFIFYSPLIHLNEFLIGNLAGFFYLKKMKHRNYDLIIILLIISFLLILKYSSLNFHNGLMAVIFVPLIILISSNTGATSMILQKRLFVYLGEISFAMYILQAPISCLTMRIRFLFPFAKDNLNYFILYIIILIISSIVCFEIIEKPSRSFIKKLNKKQESTGV